MHNVPRLFLCCAIFLIVALAATADSQKPSISLELTGTWGAGGSLGPWDGTPGPQYQNLAQTSHQNEMDPFQLTDLCITLPLGRFQLLTRAEQTPELAKSSVGTGFFDDSGDVVPFTVESRQTTLMRSYDVVLARPFVLGTSGLITPSLGATYLRGRSSLQTASGQAGEYSFSDSEGCFGVALGLRASWSLSNSTAITGDLISRWAPARTATITRFETGPQSGGWVMPVTEQIHYSRSMFGGELGLSWQASPIFGLATGWRYRDWQFDTGPGDIHGPFVRLSIRI